ncbi:ABC-2 type transport system permease protein [Dysgonomonas sp. PH5-45]|uniref:ABC transporter permease n=1 Tax=unclassified Dysgonomonas TaxID=2630389 RepID=UPI0024759314|nr:MULTISPECIES: ABC transporter permease [unclassified Dysgonomonas]MDH6354842.1 ABC-2 type transport system permease protein [Dysgonomonas sp. PH5-45]MDH6387741.1 ABC-2 type transport system permease protein [Dysgonomonas sp. PH5-37]
MNTKTGIWAIAKREFRRMASSKICIWGIVFAPIFSLCLLIYMMNAGLPTKIPIAVVDLDNSSTSRALARQLDAFAKTDIAFKSLSFREAREQMERWEVYAVLTIPRDFSKDATSGAQPKLVFYTNNAFLISGSLLFQDLKTACVLASASVGLKTAEAKGITESQIMPVLQPITVESHALSNPWLNYSLYLNNMVLPGILQLIVLMFTVSALGCEVKAGEGSKLMNMGGNSIWKVMCGKLLPYTAVYMLIALLFMSILYFYNHFPLNNGFVPMLAGYFALIIATQALGVILLGIFPNYRLALSTASLIGILTFSLTGFSFPIQAMDSCLYAISHLLPLRHFFRIYVDQALNGLTIGYSAYSYAILLCFVLLSFLFYGRIKDFLSENKYEE